MVRSTGGYICKKTSENVLGSTFTSWFSSSYDMSGSFNGYSISCTKNRKVSPESSIMTSGTNLSK